MSMRKMFKRLVPLKRPSAVEPAPNVMVMRENGWNHMPPMWKSGWDHAISGYRKIVWISQGERERSEYDDGYEAGEEVINFLRRMV